MVVERSHTDIQTDRQTDRSTHTHTHTDGQVNAIPSYSVAKSDCNE